MQITAYTGACKGNVCSVLHTLLVGTKCPWLSVGRSVRMISQGRFGLAIGVREWSGGKETRVWCEDDQSETSRDAGQTEGGASAFPDCALVTSARSVGRGATGIRERPPHGTRVGHGGCI